MPRDREQPTRDIYKKLIYKNNNMINMVVFVKPNFNNIV